MRCKHTTKHFPASAGINTKINAKTKTKMSTKTTSQPAAPKAASVPKVAEAPVSGDVSAITNKMFWALAPGQSAVVAGLLKGIKDKEGTFSSVTQFKGSFAFKAGELVNTSKTMYLPTAATQQLRDGAAKINGWDSLEFKFTITRTEKEYSVSFNIQPRKEQSRALSLLAS